MQVLSTFNLLGYIDGGSASMIFQAVVGGLLAFGYFVSFRLGNLWARFRPASRKPDSSPK
ncbi:MAG: hypothetical protein KIS66_04790 [Fimbriimonadaceae bacterium]|nr:hypothetical protein [Fimbriimonadaceae bacterium]